MRKARRYSKDYPGELFHMDTKKLPAIKGDNDKSKEIKKRTIDSKYDPMYVHTLAQERKKKANTIRSKLLHGALRSIIEEKLQSKQED